MDISQKITLLNKTTLESLNEADKLKIIGRFTQTGLKILGADFGFAYWKAEKDEDYSLVYKSPNMTYEPRLPRKKGHAYRVEKTKQPYMGIVKKERIGKYDMSTHMKSIVIIPIFYKSDKYGSLVLCYKNKRKFSREDNSLASALGNATAQAITIHSLYSNLKKAKSELEVRVRQRTSELEHSLNRIAEDKAKDEAVFTNIGEGVIATDKSGKVILTNPQAEKMLGWDKSEILGKNVFEVHRLLDDKGNPIEQTKRPVHLALQTGKRILSNPTSNFYSLRKDGKKFPVAVTATPIVVDGEITGTIQVLRDISEEREIDRVKSELISLVSHQLRTPLSAINWYTESLLSNEIGKVNRDQKKYLKQIYNANQKMIELVYDFLNVSRIELGTFSIKLSDINVVEITQSILKELQPLVIQKKLQITEKYGPGLEHLEADKKIVRLILQNLITNSVKYTPANGRVEVNISLHRPSKKEAVISAVISDTGVGIPKKQQSKIFSKLFRADNVLQFDTQGTGLGLYLVKSFVDFTGGDIKFKSKENYGTTFYVQLPITTQSEMQKQQEKQEV